MSDMDLGGTDQLAFELPKQCSCGAKMPADCQYIRLYDPVDVTAGRRKRDCLRRIDPATAPWPPGFGEAA